MNDEVQEEKIDWQRRRRQRKMAKFWALIRMERNWTREIGLI